MITKDWIQSALKGHDHPFSSDEIEIRAHLPGRKHMCKGDHWVQICVSKTWMDQGNPVHMICMCVCAYVRAYVCVCAMCLFFFNP